MIATITIETSEHGNTKVRATFDPPIKDGDETLCEYLACVAVKAVVEEGKRLLDQVKV